MPYLPNLRDEICIKSTEKRGAEVLVEKPRLWDAYVRKGTYSVGIAQ